MNKQKEKDDHSHESVLLSEAIEFLHIVKDGIYLDATLGLGGHAEQILDSAEGIKLIGFDQDLEAIKIAEKRLAKYEERTELVNCNFSDIKHRLAGRQIDGVIADLGVSSLQFDSETRGFSFRFDAPLDMRMNQESSSETASELLKRLSETEIADIIYQFGEERHSRRIARLIVKKRELGEPVETTNELAQLVKRAVPGKGRKKIHPATKTFQALRIAVNKELEILEEFIRESVKSLKTKGRLVVIAFHSLEDRIVKRTMQNLSGTCFCPRNFPKCVCGRSDDVKILTRKPVIPNESEVAKNPRSRSAKLRACEKK